METNKCDHRSPNPNQFWLTWLLPPQPTTWGSPATTYTHLGGSDHCQIFIAGFPKKNLKGDFQSQFQITISDLIQFLNKTASECFRSNSVHLRVSAGCPAEFAPVNHRSPAADSGLAPFGPNRARSREVAAPAPARLRDPRESG